ncbi:DUF4192 domain-containing protein [Nocardia sp. NPDC050175]|uniref:DUF4192 domain-containing protein n=1 Tax=Nocardia sp. NPDC050175 TaxID=3364317 RepID=UPI0037B98D3E
MSYIDDPGDLVAAVPAMLGFVPERSLLMVVLTDSACEPQVGAALVSAVLRFDLELPPEFTGDLAEIIADAVIRICSSSDSTEVLAVIVDDRVTAPPSPWFKAVRQANDALIAALVQHLADAGIGLEGAWATAAIESEQLWWSVLGPPNRGSIPDPAISAVTVALKAADKPVYASRAELAALVEPDQEQAEQVGRSLPSARATVRRRYAAKLLDGDPDGGTRWALKRALKVIAALDSGCLPTIYRTAELAAILADRRVRDGLFATALSNYARPAEALWSHLTRTLPSPQRAEAATLLAYSAYVRGEGPLAGIALQTALDTAPYHHFALLLEASLEIGMDPLTMRRIGRSGAELMQGLGIEIELPEASS